jgi:hypothetical protein
LGAESQDKNEHGPENANLTEFFHLSSRMRDLLQQ